MAAQWGRRATDGSDVEKVPNKSGRLGTGKTECAAGQASPDNGHYQRWGPAQRRDDDDLRSRAVKMAVKPAVGRPCHICIVSSYTRTCIYSHRDRQRQAPE